ncbi:MAG: hypothetical protein QGM50_04530 [Anaerolineae bacterium]|nr:hypothetical protein [Anaerolineae bacterium]
MTNDSAWLQDHDLCLIENLCGSRPIFYHHTSLEIVIVIGGAGTGRSPLILLTTGALIIKFYFEFYLDLSIYL